DGPEIALQKDCWSPNACWLAASRGPRTTLWHVSRDREYPESEDELTSLDRAVWSPKGGQLALQSDDGQIQVWDSVKKKITLRLTRSKDRLPPNAPAPFHWTPDGRHLVVRRGFLVETWDVQTGKLLGECHVSPTDSGPLLVSPDGLRIAQLRRLDKAP